MRRILAILVPLAALASPQPQPAVHARMQQHVELTQAVRAAILRGDVEGAAVAATELQRLPREDLPERWGPVLQELSEAAREARGSPDVEAAADELAGIALLCADCHAQTGGGPKVAPADPPAVGADRAGHMVGHLWAVERMWLGLVAASPETFDSGARALVDAPPHPGAGDVARPERTSDLETDVHALAATPRADLVERARAFGDILGACGTCHLRMEGEAATPE